MRRRGRRGCRGRRPGHADLAGAKGCVLHEDLAGLCWSFTEPFDEPAAVVARWRAALDAYGLAADIERNAAAGSARHRVLLDRGDAAGIRAARAWVARHRGGLRT